MTFDQKIAVSTIHMCSISRVQNWFYHMGILFRETHTTVSLNFSLPLSHLLSFFLSSAPVYPPRSALLQSTEKHTF